MSTYPAPESASYSAFLDVESALSTPDRCPGCAAAGLQAVVDGEQTLFRCPSCGQAWHIELGWVTPVSFLSSAAVLAGTKATQTATEAAAPARGVTGPGR